jgi:hypothetical protein
MGRGLDRRNAGGLRLPEIAVIGGVVYIAINIANLLGVHGTLFIKHSWVNIKHQGIMIH